MVDVRGYFLHALAMLRIALHLDNHILNIQGVRGESQKKPVHHGVATPRQTQGTE